MEKEKEKGKCFNVNIRQLHEDVPHGHSCVSCGDSLPRRRLSSRKSAVEGDAVGDGQWGESIDKHCTIRSANNGTGRA